MPEPFTDLNKQPYLRCPRCRVKLTGPMTKHRILEVIPPSEATLTRLADPHVTVQLTDEQTREIEPHV